MIKIGIIGGTGYTGVELLRLLATHPEAELKAITSRGEAGKKVADLFPSLRGHIDLAFTEPDPKALAGCDVVFSATPNGVAMTHARELVAAGVKLIDLAADFRLRDPAVWEKWYGMPHACPGLLAEAVYGLPEVNREAIRQARVVANPGCYPTAVQLGFLPLLEKGLVDATHLVADCKSGVSGAGRKAEVAYLFAEDSDNFRAYGVPAHRHWPEIRQGLDAAAGRAIGLTFVPHLTPMIRGIHATLYARLTDKSVDLQGLYEKAVCRRIAPEEPSGYAIGARLQCLPRRHPSSAGRGNRGGAGGDRQPREGRCRAGCAEHEHSFRPRRAHRPRGARVASVAATSGGPERAAVQL